MNQSTNNGTIIKHGPNNLKPLDSMPIKYIKLEIFLNEKFGNFSPKSFNNSFLLRKHILMKLPLNFTKTTFIMDNG